MRRRPHIGVGGRVADGMAGAAGGVMGGIGGVMGGIGGFTGLIPMLRCTLRGFDKDEQRRRVASFWLRYPVQRA
ncbi:conserved hypothetical protein [Cupriavidus phytorum]|uniref:Uncharacterized protein n=2 Tax=Cupriavidus TaxID=106589 RepID=A0A375CNE8_9BURK|nr:hypothetical protein C7416_10730 [Cupriavidus alkaliphilus]SOY76387.1 conserved hypothetical protein [Cupriavidus taiwanensis]